MGCEGVRVKGQAELDPGVGQGGFVLQMADWKHPIPHPALDVHLMMGWGRWNWLLNASSTWWMTRNPIFMSIPSNHQGNWMCLSGTIRSTERQPTDSGLCCVLLLAAVRQRAAEFVGRYWSRLNDRSNDHIIMGWKSVWILDMAESKIPNWGGYVWWILE